MALITCPECAKEIRDNATACPHCGNLTADRPNAAPNNIPATSAMTSEDMVTTETTGKEWKIVRLIGGLLMAAGVVAWVGNSTDAGMVFLLGCMIYLGGRLGAWWMQRT